jgi:spore germination cell wall hydrolase CwlJ-like protein
MIDDENRFYYGRHTIATASPVSIEMPQPITLPPLPPTPVTTSRSTVKPKSQRHDQIKCMADNIYHESAGEPREGQIAVARVVMNRIRHGFASTPCRVIYQMTKDELEVIHCQFSWVCQGKQEPYTQSWQYQVAEDIARQVINDDAWNDQLSDDILFFHNKTVKNPWGYKESVQIGNHTFYSKQTKKK